MKGSSKVPTAESTVSGVSKLRPTFVSLRPQNRIHHRLDSPDIIPVQDSDEDNENSGTAVVGRVTKHSPHLKSASTPSVETSAQAHLFLLSHADARALKQTHAWSHVVKINDWKSAILFSEQIEDWNSIASVVQIHITRRVKTPRLSLSNRAHARGIFLVPGTIITSIGVVPCLVILAIAALQATTSLPSRLIVTLLAGE